MDAIPRSETTLPQMLAHRARHASDFRLVMDTAGGILVASAAAYWRPAGWLLLLCASMCFAAFGAWGIADRELSERPPQAMDSTTRALRVTRGISVVVGVVAAIALLLVACGFALGSLIS